MSFPLNAAQREAVRYLDGPLLVLAGAGSGKTRVIAAKIGFLIERGFDPAGIVAITFTNRAAREMRERAGELLAKEGRRGLAENVASSACASSAATRALSASSPASPSSIPATSSRSLRS